MEEIKRKQKLFLPQFLGGPALYSMEFGPPAMRQRHLPHEVTPTRDGKPDENRGRKAMGLKSCARVQATDKHTNLQWYAKRAFVVVFVQSAETTNNLCKLPENVFDAKAENAPTCTYSHRPGSPGCRK